MKTSTLILAGISSWIVLISFIYLISTWFYAPAVLAIAITGWLASCFWLLKEYEIAPLEEAL